MGTYFIASRSENHWKVTFPRRHLSRIPCFLSSACLRNSRRAPGFPIGGAGTIGNLRLGGAGTIRNLRLGGVCLVLTTQIPTRNPSKSRAIYQNLTWKSSSSRKAGKEWRNATIVHGCNYPNSHPESVKYCFFHITIPRDEQTKSRSATNHR